MTSERTSRAAAESLLILDGDGLVERLARDYIALLDREAGIARALEVIVRQAGLIWDGDEPVHPKQGGHLDAILFEVKTALSQIDEPEG